MPTAVDVISLLLSRGESGCSWEVLRYWYFYHTRDVKRESFANRLTDFLGVINVESSGAVDFC